MVSGWENNEERIYYETMACTDNVIKLKSWFIFQFISLKCLNSENIKYDCIQIECKFLQITKKTYVKNVYLRNH